jgi:hypothetical protein
LFSAGAEVASRPLALGAVLSNEKLRNCQTSVNKNMVTAFGKRTNWKAACAMVKRAGWTLDCTGSDLFIDTKANMHVSCLTTE